MLFQNEPFSWKIQQITTVGHPAPPIASAESGSDIWRLFNETLPFVPARKEFFEEVLWLAQGQQAHDAFNPSGIALAEIETPAGKAIIQRRLDMYPVASNLSVFCLQNGADV